MPPIKLIILLSTLFVFNLSTLPDKIATNYLDNALKASATAYVAARGINATISLLQDIDLSIGFVSGSPGELLDPVNDLIERFSNILLISTTSLGIQKIMLGISGWLVIKIFITLLLSLLISHLLLINKTTLISQQYLPLIYKGIIFSLVLRFAIPIMAISSGLIENLFIEEQISSNITQLQKTNESTARISKLKGDIINVEPEPPAVTSSNQNAFKQDVYQQLKMNADIMLNALSRAATQINPTKKIIAEIKILEQQLSESISTITQLISLFIVQSIVLPLLFFYLILFTAKNIYRYEFTTH